MGLPPINVGIPLLLKRHIISEKTRRCASLVVGGEHNNRLLLRALPPKDRLDRLEHDQQI
jgi:hypothetical protein